MHIDFKFLQTGGVPLTANLMDEIKKSFEIYNALGQLAGNLTIIKGCDDISATEVGPGIVYVNGELLPFEGGTKSATVFVFTQEILKTFKDASQKVLIIKKTVRFGNSVPPNLFNWADFARLKPLRDMQDLATRQQMEALTRRVELLELKTAPVVNGGIVWAWNKPAGDIPAGWRECLDLRGKTIVGLDPGDPDFGTLGAVLGSKTHALAEAEMPDHAHAYDRVTAGVMSGSGNSSNGSKVAYIQQAATTRAGQGRPHNNIQPSRIALFIEPNFQ